MPPSRVKIEPDPVDRQLFISRVGPLPIDRTPIEARPADPLKALYWDSEHGATRHHDGQHRAPLGPIERLSVEPPEDALFGPGIVLVTSALTAVTAPYPEHRHYSVLAKAGGIAGLLARHCRGDLGEYGRLDTSKPLSLVRSSFQIDRANKWADPGATTQDLPVAVATIFGLFDHPDPSLQSTVTLFCLGGEPFLRAPGDQWSFKVIYL